MGAKVHIAVRRGGAALFEAKNDAGESCLIDGAAEAGGTGRGLRPMELVLAALAGCSAADVLVIMKKQRQALASLDVDLVGERADETPAVYSAIDVVFTGQGDFELDKLERAVALSVEKYCSVARMLAPTVTLRFSARRA